MTTPENVPGEHYGDHQAQPVWVPAHYRTGPLVGAGRWVPIYSPVEGPPAGVLYTDDDQVLGFMPVGVMAHPYAPQVTHVVGVGLREAAALGRPVSAVFDAWAQRDGRGLAAGEIVRGDLRDLG